MTQWRGQSGDRGGGKCEDTRSEHGDGAFVLFLNRGNRVVLDVLLHQVLKTNTLFIVFYSLEKHMFFIVFYSLAL